MPLIETGQPAPHHYFTDPDEARAVIAQGIEFLIEVDGYTAEAVTEFCTDAAEAVEEEEV